VELEMGGVVERLEIEDGRGGGEGILPTPLQFSPLRATAHAISILIPSRAAKHSFFHQFRARCGWLAGNGLFGRSSRARPNAALRTVLCNNMGEPSQPNGLFFAPPMRAKESPGYKYILNESTTHSKLIYPTIHVVLIQQKQKETPRHGIIK
jgi:hypothetical protein